MRRILPCSTVLMVFLILVSGAMAQNPASVYWSCMLPDSQKVSAVAGNVVGLPQTGSPGFVVCDYKYGPGPEQRWYPYENGAAVSWGAETTYVATRWIQYALHPKSNMNMTVDSMTIYLGGKGTDKLRARLFYDTDTSFANKVEITDSTLWLKKDTDSLYHFQLNADVLDGQLLYIRIYPWNTNSTIGTGKYIYVRQCTVHSTTRDVTYPASATWSLTDPATGGTGLTVATAGLLIAPDEFLNNMEINKYTGPDSSQRIRILGNAWPALQTTLIDTVFAQFSVSPQVGYNLKVTSISLGIAGNSTDKMKAEIYYSTDPTFATSIQIPFTTPDATGNNYLPIDALVSVAAETDVDLASGETFYLRVYPWVHNNSSVTSGKYLCLKNVVIGGEVSGSAAPAYALWPFETNDIPITGGSVLAQQQAYSDAMKFYNITQLPTTTTSENVTCGTIQTVSKSWNAEPNPTDSLYFQYAVAPKFGGTFYVTEVSLLIGGWYSSNMRAAFYYSKDSTFATRTLLIADTLLPGNAVMPLKVTLDETVNTGETFYLRVYPHNTEAVGWAKLVAVDSVMISGTTTGVTADPPTVITGTVTNISTTFATCGGTVVSDGGTAVTVRGVCWDTTTAPTINKHKTENGAGSGTFISQMTDLTPGLTYYVRAYATNDAGTGYGEEISFQTLDSMGVPTVVTAAVTNIMVKTAICGGNVTFWGGDTVRARGVCWNTTGNPTIGDQITENGSGLGSFQSILFPLAENTTYYVRAYATNDKGTGYGLVDTFQTQTMAPEVFKVVAADSSGDYTTVQAAFDDIPEYYTGPYIIYIKSGVYYEKLLLDRYKTNVILVGEDVENTILTYDDYAGKAGGTSMSYSVAIDADDFTAMNITFRNTVKNDGTFNDQQAVALRVNGDRQAYYNCKLLGYQDTYYTWGGRGTARIYMNNCYIEGSVDVIFGRDIVVFDSCEIHINRNGGTLTAASTEADSKFGYVFRNCVISADAVGFNEVPIGNIYLGRPWQASPRTVFIQCEEPACLNAAGWLTWNVTPALYAEYQCTGPGSEYSGRINISRQLTNEEFADYTLENIFSKNTSPNLGYDWMPVLPKVAIDGKGKTERTMPTAYRLAQNYPNPFNPVTTIKYDLLKPGRVSITVYNLLGEKVLTLVNTEQPAGYHSVMLDGSRLASGVYFYRIEAGDFCKTRKMMLLK